VINAINKQQLSNSISLKNLGNVLSSDWEDLNKILGNNLKKYKPR
jgi:hypothetical protein